MTSAASLPAAASVLTRVMSCPPGARTISILMKGKRLLKALITSLLHLGEIGGVIGELAFLLRRLDQLRAGRRDSGAPARRRRQRGGEPERGGENRARVIAIGCFMRLAPLRGCRCCCVQPARPTPLSAAAARQPMGDADQHAPAAPSAPG